MTQNQKNSIPKLVISTQPIEQAEKLKSALSGSGVDFFSIPMIKTQTIEPNEHLVAVLKKLSLYDRIIFTSKNGVSSFFEILKKLQIHFPKEIQTAVIGKGTATELKKKGFRANHLNPGNTSVEFAEYLNHSVISPNENILLVQGTKAPDFLEKELSGKLKVTRVNVYQTLPVEEINQQIIELIKSDQYGLLVFSSPSAFEFFSKHVNTETQKFRILSIGNITTSAIISDTKSEIITAEKPGTEYLKKEIIHYFNQKI
ncbi:MAG: uroporphyrinogen-III synthase [Bacteroidales bacterium]|nr:uroporphyrinogen-III synthase [Bacteroidales bacterium]